MSLEENHLPSSWLETSLGEVIDYGTSIKADPDAIADDTWVLELEDIERDTSKILARQNFADRQSKSTKNRFAKGDVLYGKLRPYLNKIVIADQDGVCTTEIVPLKPNEVINGPYLFYWLKHPIFLDYVNAVSYGVNMPRLGTKDGKAAPFILAPLAEQKRIANKLDTVLARVDVCRERLNRVPLILKRFKLSVLAAATSGKLTEDWRNSLMVNSIDWMNVSLSQIGELGRGKSKHRPRNDPKLFSGDYPFIQTGDITNSGGLITEHNQTYSEFGLAQSKLWPAKTLCITIAANIADTAILSYPACFPDSIVGFAADPSKCLTKYIKWTIDVIKTDLETYAPATAQKNINLSILNEIKFRLPSIEEQQEIVLRVETLFAFADRLEARLSTARNATERLTSAILAKAFRGELVPQDPNDEPASELLERISEMHRIKTKKINVTAIKQSPKVRVIKEKKNMAKSRQDVEVKHQPYLAEQLRQLGGAANVEALFKAADLPVTDFYKQLAWEVENGHIHDAKSMLEAA